jgi:hypothetical protein
LLPRVQLILVGGPGVAMLAASYATERGLKVTAHLPEFGRFPERAAIERRDTEVIALADAAVVVLAGNRELGVAVARIGEGEGYPWSRHRRGKLAKVKPTAPPPEPEVRRGLPD